MKTINKTLCQALLATLTLPAAHAMAMTNDENYCEFQELRSGYLKVHVREMGTLYVPRDARIGTTIGTPGSPDPTADQNNLVLTCSTYGERINFEHKAVHGIHTHVQAVDGQFHRAPILKTNIPGVGAIVEMLAPFLGGADQFIPDSYPPMVPFTSYYEQTRLSPVAIGSFRHRLTLVKTGELTPGVHQLDGPLVTGHLGWKGFGKVQEFSVRATIIQTQCEVQADAVSANPVDLGHWNTSDFTHLGYTTLPTDFQIRLNNCQVDPDEDNQTLATIELDGSNGSGPVGPPGENVFSLTHDSEARGMGIQMLYNGDPMPLNQELDLVPVTRGNVTLNFKARFFQTEPSSAVRAGSAKGALNFTIRYR
ncbi:MULTISPECIES: fimbrial protein [Pseudomonas]|uniref:fimbrial protein n=1 Tax=Pseudomonas TaxID=286 RepID=UPI0015964B69|nr:MULTISPECIES: fimbrial protein [Pseudomonas]